MKLTSKEITARLQHENLSAAEYQQLIGAIDERKAALKSRSESIEGSNGHARLAAVASGEPEQIAALNRESELLDGEMEVLFHLQSRARQLFTLARDRETISAGERAHDRVGSLVEAAASACAEYEAARLRLTDALNAITAANGLRDAAERCLIKDTTLQRLIAALWPRSLVLSQSDLSGAVSGLKQRLCAPPAPTYNKSQPNLFQQLHAKLRDF